MPLNHTSRVRNEQGGSINLWFLHAVHLQAQRERDINHHECGNDGMHDERHGQPRKEIVQATTLLISAGLCDRSVRDDERHVVRDHEKRERLQIRARVQHDALDVHTHLLACDVGRSVLLTEWTSWWWEGFWQEQMMRP